MRKASLLVITNCMYCPFCKTQPTPRAGCATDYMCALVRTNEPDNLFKKIKGYVEWGSEEPKDNEIPDWCPLPTGELDE